MLQNDSLFVFSLCRQCVVWRWGTASTAARDTETGGISLPFPTAILRKRRKTLWPPARYDGISHVWHKCNVVSWPWCTNKSPVHLIRLSGTTWENVCYFNLNGSKTQKSWASLTQFINSRQFYSYMRMIVESFYFCCTYELIIYPHLIPAAKFRVCFQTYWPPQLF